jgi:RNA polymerase sigma-70 factor, ECF subfamily
MTLPPNFRDGLLHSVPSMRAFAISLTGNVDQADDLVQEAMVRRLVYIDQFLPRTNIQVWLFTILRNQLLFTGRDDVR